MTDEELGDKLEEVKIKDIKEEVYRMMKFSEVPGEKISHTIMKAYMYIIAELPEETHSQLLDLQLEHKEKLFLIADGKKPADIEDGDPIEALRKELRDEEEKKERGGEPINEKEQKELEDFVEDFLNRDEKKEEEKKEVKDAPDDEYVTEEEKDVKESKDMKEKTDTKNVKDP